MTACPTNSSSPQSVVSTIGRCAGVALSLLLASAAVWQMWQSGERVPGVDFYQFWVVGTELHHGGAVDIYSDTQRAALGKTWLEKAQDRSSRQYRAAVRRPVLETFSTPWLYAVFAALSTGDYERDYKRYRLLCLAVSVASIIGLCRVFQYSWNA